jgi:hypothetical protein
LVEQWTRERAQPQAEQIAGTSLADVNKAVEAGIAIPPFRWTRSSMSRVCRWIVLIDKRRWQPWSVTVVAVYTTLKCPRHREQWLR